MSRYGTYEGVPVAVFGALWFAVAGLLSVSGLTARQTVRESVPGYLFVLSTSPWPSFSTWRMRRSSS